MPLSKNKNVIYYSLLIKRLYLKYMSKQKFVGEFEINASQKMLYPYIFTAGGLAQWFADDVTIDEDKIFNFIWDGEDHKAKMIAHRTNSFVKFEFISNGDEEDDPAFFELRLEKNELTQSVFIRVIDYSEFDDQEELHELWDGLIEGLRETVGG